VDEGIGVQALDGDGGGHGVGQGAAEFAGGEEEDGAHALAAGVEGVAEGGVQRGGAFAGGRHEGLDARFDAVAEGRQIFF
jgi:hypothetical protein